MHCHLSLARVSKKQKLKNIHTEAAALTYCKQTVRDIFCFYNSGVLAKWKSGWSYLSGDNTILILITEVQTNSY